MPGEEDGYSYGEHAETASAEEEHRGRTKGRQCPTLLSVPFTIPIGLIESSVKPNYPFDSISNLTVPMV